MIADMNLSNIAPETRTLTAAIARAHNAPVTASLPHWVDFTTVVGQAIEEMGIARLVGAIVACPQPNSRIM